MPRKKQTVEISTEGFQKVTQAHNEEAKVEPSPLRKQNDGAIVYKVIHKGIERYYTKDVIETILQRNHDKQREQILEIPKGSPFVVADHLKGGCRGCG